MGSNNSRELKDEEIENLKEETGFSRTKLNQLFIRFQTLDKSSKGYLTKEDLLAVDGLEINPLADRIVDSCFQSEEKLNFEKFVKVLATFRRCKKHDDNDFSSRRSKLKFVFSMYDTNGDGTITKEKMIKILSMMVGSNVTIEQLHLIAERTILDSSPFSRAITFEDFEKVMTDAVVENKMVVKFQN